METSENLNRKKDLILGFERIFASQIGGAALERPVVSFWMVLIPILFLYFIYRMQKYKRGRVKFNEDFMITRNRAMDLSVEAIQNGLKPDINHVVGKSNLPDELAKPYGLWVRALVEYYTDLLAANGDRFETLVRAAYGNRTNFLLVLNRLSGAEKEFYSALKPQLAETEGAAAIIATIEEKARQLRRELAERIFP